MRELEKDLCESMSQELEEKMTRGEVAAEERGAIRQREVTEVVEKDERRMHRRDAREWLQGAEEQWAGRGAVEGGGGLQQRGNMGHPWLLPGGWW